MPQSIFDIRADRWTMFRSPSFGFPNEDFAGAIYKMQVRSQWNETGAPLIDLANAASAAVEGVRTIYAGTDTVANHIAAGRLDEAPPGYSLTAALLLSLVGMRINKATMTALPFPQERQDDLQCVYDLWITPVGGDEQRRLVGLFIAEAGSTQ